MKKLLCLFLFTLLTSFAFAAEPVKSPLPTTPVFRGLLGGGFDYNEEHNLGYHLFTGIQFPKDKFGGNWQWQLGLGYQPQADVDISFTYFRTWHFTQQGAGPWNASTSVVYVFAPR